MTTYKSQASQSEDLTLFAIDSIDKVLGIGNIIINSKEEIRKTAAPFCCNLRNILLSISTLLKDQKRNRNNTGKKKVEALLNNLERLCTWPQPLKRNWPTLRALKFIRQRNNAVECLQDFGAHRKFAKNRGDIIEGLTKFSAETFQNETTEIMQTNEVSANECPPHMGHELDDDIEHLLKILQRYRSCNRKGANYEIRANIQLNGYRALAATSAATEFIVESASAEFGVFFLDHPHAEDGCWQETRIQICHTKSSKVPIVNFTGEKPQSPTIDLAQARNQYEPLPCDSFCRRISARGQDMLYFSTQENEFVYHKSEDTSRAWHANQEAVSLASILKKPKLNFNDKSKAILEMLVAKATWQFYDSDVIGEGLTSDSIHFLCEEREGKNGIFGNEPMLVARFGDRDGEDVVPIDMIHKNPKILALGILLLELETRKTMKEHRENGQLHPSGPFNINTDYKIAAKLVSTGSDAHPESIINDLSHCSPLRKILPLCIKSEELGAKIVKNLNAQKVEPSSTTINEQNALRSIIYSEIVKPLEDWTENYYYLNRVKPLYEVEVVRDVPDKPSLPSPRLQLTYQQAKPISLDEKKLRKESRQWFENYEKLLYILRPRYEEMGKGYKQSKIAVLDTGITPSRYQYLKDHNSCAKPPPALEYRDFVDNTHQDSPCDDTEHGTAGVSLINKTCPNASLYIARVMKTNHATYADVARVVQGIDWAIKKNVDVITLAIGFETVQHAVVEAIDRAYRRGIIIFSGASNRRNVKSVCCPANVTDKVFGIFSTDAGIRESRSLNPTKLNPNSFAIFGEDVELDQRSPLVRGTSYSTSIAAGLAALLLDFVQQEQQRPDAAKLFNFKNQLQLTRVFQEMAKKDNGYYCLQPWKLLDDQLKNNEELRQQQRDWIWGTIVRLMHPDKLHELQQG
ncbi:hypothetical protein M434DRAFT_30071 [Hypoxylon sp. CO27-5]|nr:hypothetical protein M434DRAFT_30071 [Hypoxylon sp. CO27-5]